MVGCATLLSHLNAIAEERNQTITLIKPIPGIQIVGRGGKMAKELGGDGELTMHIFNILSDRSILTVIKKI